MLLKASKQVAHLDNVGGECEGRADEAEHGCRVADSGSHLPQALTHKGDGSLGVKLGDLVHLSMHACMQACMSENVVFLCIISWVCNWLITCHGANNVTYHWKASMYTQCMGSKSC